MTVLSEYQQFNQLTAAEMERKLAIVTKLRDVCRDLRNNSRLIKRGHVIGGKD